MYVQSNSHTAPKFSFLKLLTPLKDRVTERPRNFIFLSYAKPIEKLHSFPTETELFSICILIIHRIRSKRYPHKQYFTTVEKEAWNCSKITQKMYRCTNNKTVWLLRNTWFFAAWMTRIQSHSGSLKQIFSEMRTRRWKIVPRCQLNFNGKRIWYAVTVNLLKNLNLPITNKIFCFENNPVKFVAILLVEKRSGVRCMYKTLNMSTNVRSASRTSFVAQFKQLTVLLALSLRSKYWCLVFKTPTAS